MQGNGPGIPPADIILLAFVVNAVELICSARLLAVYTQVLALSNLPPWQYHAYLALYILNWVISMRRVIRKIPMKHLAVNFNTILIYSRPWTAIRGAFKLNTA